MATEDFSISKLQAMDEAEWERLQSEYSSRIYFFVKRYVGDHQTTEDLTQEAFLGAVRGIANFDPTYSLEQFLFGIARNRVVDHFRKGKIALISPTKDEGASGSYLGLEQFASERRRPDESAVVHERAIRQRKVLVDILREYVSELWQGAEFEKLKVLEFLFALGGRNKDAAKRFEVRDEKAVAGIKFRAIERLRALARQRDPNHSVFLGLWAPGGTMTGARKGDADREPRVDKVDLHEAAQAEARKGFSREAELEFTLGLVWREERVSCPHRDILRAYLDESLAAGAMDYIRFHIEECQCPYCGSTLDDLRKDTEADVRANLKGVKDRLMRTTATLLRKRKR